MQAPATPRSVEPDAARPLESTPVTELRGVGPRLAAKLAGLGIKTVLDVLFHLPLRYEDRTRIHAIGDLSAGDTALTCGRIESAKRAFGRRRSLVVSIGDGTGTMAMPAVPLQREPAPAAPPGTAHRLLRGGARLVRRHRDRAPGVPAARRRRRAPDLRPPDPGLSRGHGAWARRCSAA